jgi:hypothetical protein
MCIACELGLLIAMDALPHEPPPGFPRAPTPEADAGFVCESPSPESAGTTQPSEDEPRP